MFSCFLLTRLNALTHSFPMHPFFTPRKHRKTVRFSDFFRGQRKDVLGTNVLMFKQIARLWIATDSYEFHKNCFDFDSRYYVNDEQFKNHWNKLKISLYGQATKQKKKIPWKFKQLWGLGPGSSSLCIKFYIFASWRWFSPKSCLSNYTPRTSC